MTSKSIRAAVLDFLADREIKNNETVEFAWFVFFIVVENDRIDLKTLDFQAMASFTTDFREPEIIHAQQMAVLEAENLELCCCTLRQSATISRSYMPGSNKAFILRQPSSNENDSGWYVGVLDDPLDVNDPNNLYLQSLYELTFHDWRLAPYWLLPIEYSVRFDSGEAVVLKP